MTVHQDPAQFLWRPGHGPDAHVLGRMQGKAQRPVTAMGQAWFLGEREIYTKLLESDVADLSVEALQTYLGEIFRGLHSFGHADNWADWYLYLLPRSMPRSFDRNLDYVIEYLVTAFMVLEPDPSKQYGCGTLREDGLATLGHAIMAPERWPWGPQASSGCLHSGSDWPPQVPIWGTASGDFSTSMFFCLKYLAANQVEGWTGSIFDIPCPRWRGQVLVWLCGAKGLIDGTVSQPADLGRPHEVNVEWAWSHIIDGWNVAYDESDGEPPQPFEFLPYENRRLFDATVRKRLDEQLLSDWLESMMEVEQLFDHITSTAIPEQVRHLYGF